jgi:hypothetical protein
LYDLPAYELPFSQQLSYALPLRDKDDPLPSVLDLFRSNAFYFYRQYQLMVPF